MTKTINLEAFKRKFGKINLPTIMAINCMDYDLLKLFAFELVKDEANVPSEILDIYNDLTSENIEDLIEQFDYNLSGDSIKGVVSEILDLNYLPINTITLEDLKNDKYKNPISNLINCYYSNKYINPFLKNRNDEGMLVETLKEKIKDIKEGKTDSIIAFYYLLEGTICLKKINQNKSVDFIEILYEGVDIVINLLNDCNDRLFKLLNDYSELLEKKSDFKKKLSSLKTDIDGLRKENKTLTKALELKKNKENNVLIREIKSEINKSSKKIQEYNVDVLRRSYENIIKKNIEEISELKSLIKIYDYKTKDIEVKYNELKESLNEEYILQYLKDNKNNEFLKNKVLNIFELDLNKIEVVESHCAITSYNSNTSEESFKDLLNEYDFEEKESNIIDNDILIGYVSIEEGRHIVNYSNGTKKEISNLPIRAFLGDCQFITTNKNGEYQYSLKQYKNEDIPFNSVLALIKEVNGKLIAEVNNETIEIDNHMNFKINDTVVGLIEGNRVKRLFKTLAFNADYYLKSIKAKGFNSYYVIKNIGANTLIREIETGREFTKKFDENLLRDDILITNNDIEIITKFNNAKFYTHSSYYENDSYGIVELYRGVYYFKDIDSNERFEINYVPNNIQDDEIVRIDEFSRFIETVDINEFIPEKQLRKEYKRNKIEKIKNNEEINIIGDVLIIGDIGLQQSYKLASLKKGYRATVLDGYESYNKVFKEAKKADKIVIAEDFVDHNTMWALKKNYDNILYAKNRGANCIAEQLANNIIGRKQMELI